MSEERTSLSSKFAGAGLDTPLQVKRSTGPRRTVEDRAERESPRPRAVDPDDLLNDIDLAPATRTRTDADPDAIAPRGFYVPGELRQWMREEKRKGRTFTDQLLDAFDSVSTEELQTNFGGVGEAPKGGMPRTPVSKKRTAVQDGVQLQISLSGAQDQWLNDQVDTVGAPSRSALIAAVFKLYREKPKAGSK